MAWDRPVPGGRPLKGVSRKKTDKKNSHVRIRGIGLVNATFPPAGVKRPVLNQEYENANYNIHTFLGKH